MLKEDTVVKVGIYTSGAHVRLIGECDLINQDNGHHDEAIYLVEITMMRDPREPIGEGEMTTYINSMVGNFRDKNFQFKVKDRAEADKFINSKIKGYEPTRELAAV